MGAEGDGEGQDSALPNMVVSHSTQPEEQSRDKDGDRGPSQPRDGQTSLWQWAGLSLVGIKFTFLTNLRKQCTSVLVPVMPSHRHW